MARPNKQNRTLAARDENRPSPPQGQPSLANVSTRIIAEKTTSYSGPIPSPEILLGYERALPGLAERIIRMAEQETAHRHKTEKDIIAIQEKDMKEARSEVRRGQHYAFVLCLAAITLGAGAIFAGHDTAGATLGTVGLGSLVTAFVVGRKAQQAVEREKPEGKEKSNLPAKAEPKQQA